MNHHTYKVLQTHTTLVLEMGYANYIIKPSYIIQYASQGTSTVPTTPAYPTTRTASRTYNSTNGGWGWDTANIQFVNSNYKPEPSKLMKDIIRNRLGPILHTSKNTVPKPQDLREIRARQTLQQLIGGMEYRRFLRRGFISVKAKSGLTYTLRRGYGTTGVYKDGVHIENMCIQLPGEYPPTDVLISRYLALTNDEELFRTIANKSKPYKEIKPIQPVQRSLPEIFAALKAA